MAFPLGRIVIEIQSVNKKHLDVSVLLPRELWRFDVDVKKWVAERVSRGAVSVRISATYEGVSPTAVTPNLPFVRQLREAWDRICEEIGVDEAFDPEWICREDGILLYTEEIKDEEIYRQALRDACDEALTHLVAMRETEGCALQKDIEGRLALLKGGIDRIAARASVAVETYRVKLQERIKQVTEGLADNDDRVMREVAIYADRLDVSEEIVRFKAHIDHFGDIVSKEPAPGKKLEFLLQEMGREINTIGSKSMDGDVARAVVDIKGELERIREQVQNVE